MILPKNVPHTGAHPKALTIEKIRAPRHANIFAKHWILILVLVPSLLLARGVTPAFSSAASAPGQALAQAVRTSTATPTATLAPANNTETQIKVIVGNIKLRHGPGTNFEIVGQVKYRDLLTLLGRLSDNTWLYVKTEGGLVGWTRSTWVDIEETSIDSSPIQTPASPPVTVLKVIGDSVNLRTGASTDFPSLQELDYGVKVTLLGRVENSRWLYVKTSDGKEGWVQEKWLDTSRLNFHYDYFPIQTPPATPTSTPVILEGVEGRWIDIDLSEQRLDAYEGAKQVGSFLVSTGVAAYPTEKGQYKIYVKYRFTDMHGPGYFLPDVPFNMFYSGDFSIHGTYWHHNFGTPMSHGCVNMDIKDAEWLFDFAEVGTIVNIHR
jgi:uncharacterized protein YraI